MPQINDPSKLFEHELGMALGAERKILTMLKQVEGKVQDEQLKQQVVQHRDETEGQIKNIEQAFQGSVATRPVITQRSSTGSRRSPRR
jgi:ferritin-like metal-binding protein YciE